MEDDDTPEKMIYKQLLEHILKEKTYTPPEKLPASYYKSYSKKTNVWIDDFWENDRYNKYTINDMLIQQTIMEEQKKIKAEEDRLASLPHYVQYYGEENPDGSVATYWIRMNGLPNSITYNHSIRTIIRQDGNNFCYVKRKHGKDAKTVPLTEEEIKLVTFIILKAREQHND